MSESVQEQPLTAESAAERTPSFMHAQLAAIQCSTALTTASIAAV